MDNSVTSSFENSILFAMTSDGKSIDDVTIPFVFLFGTEAVQLVQAMQTNKDLSVNLSKKIYLDLKKKKTKHFEEQIFFFKGGVIPNDPRKDTQLKAPTDLSIIDMLKSTFKQILTRQTSQVCIIWCLIVVFVESLTLWIIIKRS